MRAFAWFFATLIAAGILAAAIAYPVYELTSQVASWPFHRVTSRIAMLFAIGGLVWLCRHLRLTSKRDLGYGLPWRRFLKVALCWGVLGAATACVGAWFLLATRLRVVSDPAALGSASGLVHLLLVGLSSGIAVALLEETVMRGAMHSAIAREANQWTAVLLTAPLFAILHFFAKVRIPAAEVGWYSGFDLLGRSFAPLGHPAQVFDAFLAWLAVSLVLSLTRVLTGNIAAAIGLHAGWVMILRVLADSTAAGPATAWSVWVGRFDGLLGLWLLPWAGILGLALWSTRRAWVPYASGAPGPGSDLGAVNGARPSRR